MKLDDRPVIDQLLNPTPLNHLYEVQEEVLTWLQNIEESLPLGGYDTGTMVLKEFVEAMENRL